MPRNCGTVSLAARVRDIDRAFAGDGVEDMLERLAAMPGEWAQKTAATLAQKSPKSLKLTLAAIRNARAPRLARGALGVEYRLCVRLFEDGEFNEGVRALLVDKDPRGR